MWRKGGTSTPARLSPPSRSAGRGEVTVTRTNDGASRSGPRPTTALPFVLDPSFTGPRVFSTLGLAARADRVYTLATTSFGGANRILVSGLDGGVIDTWGGTSAFAPDGFCTFTGVVLCGPTAQDLCIIDENCRTFSQWTPQGQQRDRFDFFGDQPMAVAATTGGRVWVLRRDSQGRRILSVVSGL